MRLDPNEKDLLRSVESGEWRPVRGAAAEKKRFAGYAAVTFRKDRRVNIRISGNPPMSWSNSALPSCIPKWKSAAICP